MTRLATLAEGELGHNAPSLLPNGHAVLFYAWSANAETNQVAVYDFDTGARIDLLRGTTPRFVPTGHLVFWRENALWAVPFDPDRFVIEGDPVVVVEGVGSGSLTNIGAYAVSDNGTLVYQPLEAAADRTLGWVNREGEMTTPMLVGRGLSTPALSPDGTRVAYLKVAEDGLEDLWLWDRERGSETKLTESSGLNRLPTWTPDGTTVTFASNVGGSPALHSRRVDLSREIELIHQTRPGIISGPASWSPDGQTLFYHTFDAEAGDDMDIMTLPVGGEPVEFLATEAREYAPRISPNGKWLAYISNREGEDQVYVQAFPEGGRVIPISTGPGTEAVWSRDGRELFYRNGEQFWVVDVETEPEFTVASPRVLFEASYEPDLANNRAPNYDVSLDGQRFLMVQSGDASGFVVVQNWFEELKARVPAN